MRTVCEILTIHRSTLSILSFFAIFVRSIGSPVVRASLTVLCETMLICKSIESRFTVLNVSTTDAKHALPRRKLDCSLV